MTSLLSRPCSRASLTGALLLSLVGCGSSSSSNSDGGDGGAADLGIAGDLASPAMTIEEFLKAFGSVQCPYIFRCCKADEAARKSFASVDECIKQSAMSSPGCIADSVKAGRTTYDPVRGRACLDGSKQGACGPGIAALTLSCADTFIGKQKAGMPCNDACSGGNHECEKGLNCEKGMCVAPRKAGDSCAGDATCEPTTYCAMTSMKCEKALDSGAACDPAKDPPCADGYNCLGGTCKLACAGM